jgi:hypothetical protein
MKKILSLLIFLISYVAVFSQNYSQSYLYGEGKIRLRADSVFQLPIDTNGTNNGLRTSISLPFRIHGYDTGQLRYIIGDKSVRVWDGDKWAQIGGSSSSYRFGVTGEDESFGQDRYVNGHNNYGFEWDSLSYLFVSGSNGSYFNMELASANKYFEYNIQSAGGFSLVSTSAANATTATWTLGTIGGGSGTNYYALTTSSTVRNAEIASSHNISGRWIDSKYASNISSTTVSNSYITQWLEQWSGSADQRFTNVRYLMDSTGFKIQTYRKAGADDVTLYKGILVDTSSNVTFQNYPSSRQDGFTTKMLYISDANGDIDYGYIDSFMFATRPRVQKGLDSLGALITASDLVFTNGLTESPAGTVKWGGSLTNNTTISQGLFGTSFIGTAAISTSLVTINNNGAGNALVVQANGNGAGVDISYTGTTSPALLVNTTHPSGGALTVRVTTGGTTDRLSGFGVERYTSSTAATGFGISDYHGLEGDNGTIYEATRWATTWTNADAPSNQTAQLQVSLMNASVVTDAHLISGNGQHTFNQYGDGLFTAGTPVYNLQVDADGNIIEGSLAGGATPTLQQVLDAGSTLTSSETITVGTNTLSISGSGTGSFSYPLSVVNSSSGPALNALANGAGHAIISTSISGEAARLFINPSSTNTPATAISLNRNSSGAAGDGIGVAIQALVETDAGGTAITGAIEFNWAVAANATRTSYIDIEGVNSASSETYMQIQPDWILVNNLADTLATRAYARSVGGGGGGGGTINSGTTGKPAYYTGSTTLDDFIAVDYATSGTNMLLTTQNTTDVGLNIKGQVSQTANLLNISSSAGTGDLGSWTKDGYTKTNRLGLPASVSPSYSLDIQDANTGVTSLQISDPGGGQYRLKIREYGTYIDGYSSVMQVYNAYTSGRLNLGGYNVGDQLAMFGTYITVKNRFNEAQGADVASAAGAISLSTGGNAFEITGTSVITLISSDLWQNGSVVTLAFTSTATLTHGTANSGTDIGLELAGNTNFVASAGAAITLRLMEIGGTQRWREIARSAVGGGSAHTIRNEGTDLTARTGLNFIGSAVTAADDAGGNETEITFDAEVNGIADLASSGIVARTGAGTFAARTITGTANEINIADGDGVGGNPTLGFAATVTLNGHTVTVGDGSAFTMQDGTDPTKQARFELSGIAAGNTWTLTLPNASGTIALTSDLSGGYQPLDADLTSWAGVTRASGFDTWVATPSSANLRSLLTDESGTGVAYFQGGDAGTPSAIVLTNATSIPAGQLTGSVATARLTNVKQIKTIALAAPTTSDDWGFFTNQAITITNVTGVMLGTSQSVTLQLNYGDSRATADAQVVNSITFDSGETGYQTTGFPFSLTANVNVAAGTFVWFDITGVSGTVNTLELTIEYNLQ